jgi:hypothetical protein
MYKKIPLKNQGELSTTIFENTENNNFPVHKNKNSLYAATLECH